MLKLLCTVLFLFSFTVNAKWYKHSFEVMGTISHVEFWLAADDDNFNDDSKAQQLIKSIEDEMFRIDQQMSPYIEQSELSLINREASKQPVVISAELFDLITVALDISKLSHGAFDITYASVGYQYNYRENKRPNKEDIKRSLSKVDYASVLLNSDNRSIKFSSEQVRIDLGGIAKGHAVKRCIAILAKNGIKHGLISAGGDTALLGDRLGRPWLVGVKHPRSPKKNAVHIPLSNEAISTSGDYERYFIEDGIRYHHILNPKTGDSARKVISVSVIGEDPTYVDALSTTIFVKGLSEGMALINKLENFEAIIIDNNQRLHFSSGLQQ